MEAVILEIITDLMCADTVKIRQAETLLNLAYNSSETLPAMCNLIVSQHETQKRQYAAVLLSKRFLKRRNWQKVPVDQKEVIKTGVLQALIAEKEQPVMNAIAQMIASLLRHEAEGAWLKDLVSFINGRCSADDSRESELGSSLFATLTDVAPDQFDSHMEAISEMITGVLLNAEAKGDMATTTVLNIIRGMTYLMPHLSRHTSAEQTVPKVLPLIIKTLYVYSQKGNVNSFLLTYDVVDGIADNAHKLLNNHLRQLVEFCLETCSNSQIKNVIRIQLITLIGQLAPIKKNLIVKQQMLEPILFVLFEVMCSDAFVDESYSTEANETPGNAAIFALSSLAMNLSPERLLPLLFQLLEPALQHPDELRQRTAVLCIAAIAEGCSETICSKYLGVMLDVITKGIANNASIMVRSASFYALGQFSEHLQPQIAKYAPQILPILFDFLHQLVVDLKLRQVAPQHTQQMFYALENYCENLGEDLVPHLPLLMDRLFETMYASNTVHLRVMVLQVIAASIKAAKENMMPYFGKIVTTLQDYLVKECTEELNQLRIYSMNTLAEILRFGSKNNVMPLAYDSMSYCVDMLEQGPDDPEIRRAVYNLLSALSVVVKEEMAVAYPKFMEHVMDTVRSRESMVDSDTEDEDGNDLNGFRVKNDYVDEKVEAISALKDFAINTGIAFEPYLVSSIKNVQRMTYHPEEAVRKISIATICSCVIALNQLGDVEGVERICFTAMPRLAVLMRQDDQDVVICLLDCLSEVFDEVKAPSVPSETIADQIFGCIKDLLKQRMACQSNGDDQNIDESEFDKLLIEDAGNLLPKFGNALDNEMFSVYFGRVYEFFVNKLNKAKQNNVAEDRISAYGVLVNCITPLGSCAATYFDILCPIFLAGVNDPEQDARQKCYYGLGELVFYAKEKSFECFPVILQAFSVAIASETNTAALDNICGALSSLIITNYKLMPLTEVLPVLISHLPLREEAQENYVVIKALCTLYLEARPFIENHIEKILAICIEMLHKQLLPDEESINNAIGFVKHVRQQYLEKYNIVANANPEVFSLYE